MNKYSMIIMIIIYMFFSIINLNQYNDILIRQVIWYFIGFLLMIKLDKRIYKYIFYLYIIFNILLLYLLLFGKSINGSRAWINIFNFSFQPSEIMKIILIILLSIISTRYDKYVLKCLIITLIPSILTFLEPDTGNVIFYVVIFLSIILYKEKNLKHFVLPIFVLMILGSAFLMVYYFFQDFFISIFGNSFFYRMDRITSLFNNDSYQLNRALIGIGTSNLFGIDNIPAIPEETTDFAFSLLTSKIGFVGISIFLLFNMYFNFKLLDRMKYSSGVDKTIIFSFSVMKIVQESIHILMNIGLFPITGITLPFISYGGSSLLSYFVMISIISNHNNHMDDMVGMDKVQGYNKLV